jgi:hypothetical protein
MILCDGGMLLDEICGCVRSGGGVEEYICED